MGHELIPITVALSRQRKSGIDEQMLDTGQSSDSTHQYYYIIPRYQSRVIDEYSEKLPKMGWFVEDDPWFNMGILVGKTS